MRCNLTEEAQGIRLLDAAGQYLSSAPRHTPTEEGGGLARSALLFAIAHKGQWRRKRGDVLVQHTRSHNPGDACRHCLEHEGLPMSIKAMVRQSP
jgi:hypothetical protein